MEESNSEKVAETTPSPSPSPPSAREADPTAPDPLDWAAMAGRGADHQSLSALAGVNPLTLAGPDLVDAIVASERALSLLAGVQMRLLAALARPFVAGDPTRLAARLARKNCIGGDDSANNVQLFVAEAAVSMAAAEVAAALRISPVTGGIRVREAQVMTTELAPTLEALEAGVLDRGKARVIAEHCDPLLPAQSSTVQELVLAQAGEVTTSELRDITGQAVITVDPDGADERHRAAAARRELALSALPNAMATLRAFLPADGAVKIFQISDLLATGTAGSPGDTRGIGARRVDALVDIADHLLTHGHLDLTDYLGRTLPDHGLPNRRVHCSDADVATRTDDGGVQASQGSDLARGTDTECGERVAAPVPSDLPEPRTDRAAEDVECSVNVERPESPVLFDDGSGRRPGAGAVDTVGRDLRAESNDETGRGIDPQLRYRQANPTPKPAGAKSAGSAPPAIRGFTRQGRRPHLSVTMGLGTLAGLDQLPGMLAGFGAIPAGLARSIGQSAATVVSVMTDPTTGAIIDAGSLTYRPKQDLRDQIAALLAVCQFPSCRQPAWRCDVDHREPFDHRHPDQGGQTARDNAGPLCRRHHLYKHHSDWRLHLDPNRVTIHWTSPTGHRYVKRARQVAPPEMWITTAGTEMAERLDVVTANRDLDKKPDSTIEDLLAALLLRHRLNESHLEYHLEPEFWVDGSPSSTDGELPIPPDNDGDETPNPDDVPPF